MRHTLASRVTRAALFALPAVAGAFALSSAAFAAPAQYVAIDEVFTMQKYDGTVDGENFHHLVLPKADQPANWVSPVNYSTAKVYIYLDVMTKPSMAKNFLDVCFDGDLNGYGCVSSGTYTTTGVHETAGGVWWQQDKIAWTKKRTQFHVVIKNPATDGMAGGTPESDYVPSKIRMVLTMVPAGATYVPPTAMAASPDAGATADASGSGDDAGLAADAAAEVDAATGTGGSGGTGGTGNSGTGGTGEGSGTGGSSGSSGAGTGGSKSTGSSGSSGGASGSPASGKPYTTPPTSGGAKSGGSTPSQDSNASCAVAGPGARGSSGLLGLLLVGLAGAIVRRRKTRA